MMLKTIRLQNGVRVVMEPMEAVRSIAFGIWIQNGSRNELPEENGMSHFIEHMLFKGTKQRSASDIAEEMDALGGQINAYTTKEYTCYYTKVLDLHFEKALDVMSDMLLNSAFLEEEVEKERNVILEEIRMYDDAAEEVVHDALQDQILRESSLGMPILGTEKSIASFTGKSLLAYLEKNYHTENTVLSVAGHFDCAEMEKLLNNYLGQWKREASYMPHDTWAEYHTALVSVPKDIEQVHLTVAFPGFPREHEAKYAQAVFQTAFGGGMSSALFRTVREEHGLTYSIYSYTTGFRETGMLVICASMHPEQAKEVCTLIGQVVAKTKEVPFSEKTIGIVKQQMMSNFLMGRESTSNCMTSAGAAMLLRNQVEPAESVMQKMEAVDTASVFAVGKQLLDASKASLCIVGNTGHLKPEELLARIQSPKE